MTRRRLGVAAAVLLGGVSLAACGNDQTPSALDPKGPSGRHLATVWWVLLAAGGAVGVIVIAAILWFALRAPSDNPRRSRDGTIIGIGGVVLPAIVLTGVAVLTIVYTAVLRQNGAGAEALDVRVVGHQYFWEIEYPGTGLRTANELHVPVGRPVRLTLESADVIHSFWVPQLAGKQDLIPGQVHYLEFEADEPGTYWGLCAEFCGTQHGHMSFLVIADPDFDTWVARTPQATPRDDQATRGKELFESLACAGCHTIAGTAAQGDVGPDLTLLGERQTIGAGVLKNTPENLARWITDVQDIKPGAQMLPFPQLSDEDVAALVAYLEEPR